MQANTYQALTHFEYSSSGHKSKFSYFAINFYYNWGIIGMDFWIFPVLEDDCIFHDYSIIGVSIIAEQTTWDTLLVDTRWKHWHGQKIVTIFQRWENQIY